MKTMVIPAPIYWAIEEENSRSSTLGIRFYNEKNEVIFRTQIQGCKQGILDSQTMRQVNKIMQQLAQRA